MLVQMKATFGCPLRNRNFAPMNAACNMSNTRSHSLALNPTLHVRPPLANGANEPNATCHMPHDVACNLLDTRLAGGLAGCVRPVYIQASQPAQELKPSCHSGNTQIHTHQHTPTHRQIIKISLSWQFTFHAQLTKWCHQLLSPSFFSSSTTFTLKLPA